MEYILLTAISLDLFFVCLSYSIRKIRILPSSVCVLSGVSTAYLAAAAAAGFGLRQLVSPTLFTYFGFGILLCMGLANLLETPIQSFWKRLCARKFHLRLAKVHLVFEIYLDKTKADQDNSKTLTPYEAIFLALPLSLDCFITGLSIPFSPQSLPVLLPFMFLISLFFCSLGILLGHRLPLPSKNASSIISGLLLIFLAVCRLTA